MTRSTVLNDDRSSKRLSNRTKNLSQTSVFIPPLLSTKILWTVQDKVPFLPHHATPTHSVAKLTPFLIANLSNLSRSRFLVAKINLFLLYAPSASPNPSAVLLQVSHRGRIFALPLLKMRPSLPCLPLRILSGPLPPLWSRVLVLAPSMPLLPPLPQMMAISRRWLP